MRATNGSEWFRTKRSIAGKVAHHGFAQSVESHALPTKDKHMHATSREGIPFDATRSHRNIASDQGLPPTVHHWKPRHIRDAGTDDVDEQASMAASIAYAPPLR
jgi:hypothetical protein